MYSLIRSFSASIKRFFASLPKNLIRFLAICSPVLIFLFISYHAVIFYPGTYLLDSGSDGLRAYFVLEWYVNHNESWTNFEGLNYPYGENILFLDCNPVLSVVWRMLSSVFPFLAPHAIGFLNLTLFIGIVLCYWFSYKFLREMGVPAWLAMLGALLVTIISPQWIKARGNFALAYLCFIPWIMYLVLKMTRENYPWKRITGLFIINLLAFFIHPYLGAITAAFAFCSIFFHGLATFRVSSRKIAFYIAGFAGCILPLILFFLALKYTDYHLGRTQLPWGLGAFKLSWLQLVIPPFGFSRDIYESYMTIPDWDDFDHGFIPAPVLLLFLVSFVMICWLRYKRKPQVKFIPLFLLAGAIPLWAYAFAFWGLADITALAEKITPLKHFRYIIRFAWPMYYVVMLLLPVFLLNISRHSAPWIRKGLVPVTGFMIVIFILAEGHYYHRKMNGWFTENKNFFQETYTFPDLSRHLSEIPAKDFQALLPLPFFNVGANNFQSASTYQTLKMTYAAACFTGLPMTGALIIRTSENENRRLQQYVSPPYYEKPINREIQSDLPFLILEEKGKTSANEQFILDASSLLIAADSFNFRSISRSQLFRIENDKILENFLAIENTLWKSGDFYAKDSTWFIYNNLDENGDIPGYFSEKVLFGKRDNTYLLAWIPAGTLDTGIVYEASFWINNTVDDGVSGDAYITSFDTVHNQWNPVASANPMLSQTIDGDWTRVAVDFKITAPDHVHGFYFKGPVGAKNNVILDQAFVAPKAAGIYRKKINSLGKGVLFKDNYWLKTGGL